jgi:hypothetical protein
VLLLLISRGLLLVTLTFCLLLSSSLVDTSLLFGLLTFVERLFQKWWPTIWSLLHFYTNFFIQIVIVTVYFCSVGRLHLGRYRLIHIETLHCYAFRAGVFICLCFSGRRLCLHSAMFLPMFVVWSSHSWWTPSLMGRQCYIHSVLTVLHCSTAVCTSMPHLLFFCACILYWRYVPGLFWF